MKTRAVVLCTILLGAAFFAGCLFVGNIHPIAAFTATPTTGSGTPTTPLTVTFDPTGSSDPDGTIAEYAWNFGDGNTATTATLVAVTHDYSVQSGETTVFTARLTVTDNEGATDTEVEDITVSNP